LHVYEGITPLSLDAKGRLTLPSRYRERLREDCDGHLVVTIDTERCLLLYPRPNWEVVRGRLQSLPNTNPQARAYQRVYLGHAHEVDMDGQGRVLLPGSLRTFARLEHKVALVGQGNKFEIWDEDAWNHKLEAWMETAALGELQAADGSPVTI